MGNVVIQTIIGLKPVGGAKESYNLMHILKLKFDESLRQVNLRFGQVSQFPDDGFDIFFL